MLDATRFPDVARARPDRSDSSCAVGQLGNRFGKTTPMQASRDKGQSRVPAPPHKMKGKTLRSTPRPTARILTAF
jgi:hypothetical protein